MAKTVMARPKMCKFAFSKIINSEKKILCGLAPISPAVRVILKNERAIEVL